MGSRDENCAENSMHTSKWFYFPVLDKYCCLQATLFYYKTDNSGFLKNEQQSVMVIPGRMRIFLEFSNCQT